MILSSPPVFGAPIWRWPKRNFTKIFGVRNDNVYTNLHDYCI